MSNLRPLSLYIHWPFCLSKCPYCDFNSHVRERVEEDAWRRALLAELRYYASLTPGREIQTVFFGGGTPSLMSPATVAALLDSLPELWPVSSNIEITLEANPTSTEATKLAAFRLAGVNRLSMGIQALNDADLRFLGRHHSAKEALAAFAEASKIFSRISFDLIYARPHQTAAAWKSELQEALRHAGNHLSLYQLTIEPGTRFFHQHRAGEFDIPEEEPAAVLYEVTQEVMDAAGLPAYEISNHARPGEECRHNLAYWRYQDYLGIGPGAHGRYVNGAGQRLATRALRSPEAWLEAVQRQGHGIEESTPLTMQESAEEALLMGLRLSEGLSISAFDALTGENLRSRLSSPRARAALEEGLLHQSGDSLCVTPHGRLVLNSLTEVLLLSV